MLLKFIYQGSKGGCCIWILSINVDDMIFSYNTIKYVVNLEGFIMMKTWHRKSKMM